MPNAETGRTVLADCLTALGINEPVIDLVGHYPSPSVLVDVSTRCGLTPGPVAPRVMPVAA